MKQLTSRLALGLFLSVLTLFFNQTKAQLPTVQIVNSPHIVTGNTTNTQVLEFEFNNSSNQDYAVTTVQIAFSYVLAAQFSNMAVYNNVGLQLGSVTQPIGNSATFNLGGQMIVPAQSVLTFNVRTDIAPSCVIGPHYIGISLLSFQGMSSGITDTLGLWTSGTVILNNSVSSVNFTGIPDTLCQGESFIPNVTYTVDGGCTDHFTQSWNFGWPSSVQSWLGENPPLMSYYSAGTFFIQLTLTDTVTGYSQMFSRQIDIASTPIYWIEYPTSQFVCQGDSMRFVVHNNGTSSITWSYDNSVVSHNDTLYATQNGFYNLLLTTDYGCTNNYGQNFGVYANVMSINAELGAFIATSEGAGVISSDTAYLCSTPSQLTLGVITTGWFGSLEYLWSDSSTSYNSEVSLPGQYSVTVTTNNGCVATDTIYVVEHIVTPPTISADGPTSFCIGSNVTLHATTGYDSYSWNGGLMDPDSFTVYGTTTVTLIATDSFGCQGEANPIEATVSYGPPIPIILENGCELISTNMTGNHWYANGVATGDTTQVFIPGVNNIFSVVTTDSIGCSSASQSVAFELPPSPFITPNGSMTFCEGGSVFLTVQQGSEFIWSTGATTQSINVTDSGTYTVTVTNGTCVQQASPVTVTVIDCTTGVNDVSDDENFFIFPNPAQDFVEISGIEKNAKFEIMDLTGRTIPVLTISENRVDVTNLTTGMYFLRAGKRIAKFTKL